MTGVDVVEVEKRLDRMTRMVATHGGRVELDSVSADGEVRVRFGGMCTGCLMKPLTLNSLLRPALLDVEGVRTVSAVGVRMSEAAERRIKSFAIADVPLRYLADTLDRPTAAEPPERPPAEKRLA